jgi:hypothetical protein
MCAPQHDDHDQDVVGISGSKVMQAVVHDATSPDGYE